MKPIYIILFIIILIILFMILICLIIKNSNNPLESDKRINFYCYNYNKEVEKLEKIIKKQSNKIKILEDLLK